MVPPAVATGNTTTPAKGMARSRKVGTAKPRTRKRRTRIAARRSESRQQPATIEGRPDQFDPQHPAAEDSGEYRRNGLSDDREESGREQQQRSDIRRLR